MKKNKGLDAINFYTFQSFWNESTNVLIKDYKTSKKITKKGSKIITVNIKGTVRSVGVISMNIQCLKK